MRQGRKTTQEERIRIAKECIGSGKNYGEMALQYQISYQQVRKWTLRFEAAGKTVLEDRRGHRKKDHADKSNEKWLTDVTEFKWYEGIRVHKIYLSAILDLCDRRIVSYVLSERNDNSLVYRTFDKAVKANLEAHPLFRSDREFQYTNRAFYYSKSS